MSANKEGDSLQKKRKNVKEMSNKFREGLGFNSKEMTMKSEQKKSSKNFGQITKKTQMPSGDPEKRLKIDEAKNTKKPLKENAENKDANIQENIDNTANMNLKFVLDDKNGKQNLVKSKKYLDPRKEFLKALNKNKKNK